MIWRWQPSEQQEDNNIESQVISELQVSQPEEAQVSKTETTEATSAIEKRSASDEGSIVQKRRKLGPLPKGDKEQIRILKHCIKDIQQSAENGDAAFVIAHKLSEARPVLTADEASNIHLWAGDRFFSLLEALIMVLVGSKSSAYRRISTLSLLGHLLQNQRGIIQQYEKMTTCVDESIVLILADALLSRISDIDNEVSAV